MFTLTQWVQVTQTCVNKLAIIGSGKGLSPDRRQAIIWTNDWLVIIHLGTNFKEILIEIHAFSFEKIYLKMSSEKWRPFYLGFYVLIHATGKSMMLITITCAWSYAWLD